MHTTSGGADRISAWLKNGCRRSGRTTRCSSPVTENWSQFAIAGPRAREVLQKLDPSFDISHEALPHMSFVEGKLGPYPAVNLSPVQDLRLYQVFFSRAAPCFTMKTPAIITAAAMAI